jgi:septal ring factor EnvC (AmiA/AmiB activator)
MPFFEGLMVAGMVAGAAVNTLNDSFANVEDTCRQVTQANDKLTEMQDKWKSIFNDIGSAEAQLKAWQDAIETQGEAIANASIGLRETFKQKKESAILGFSVFLFITILSLLLKYFKVFHNIWDFFTK